MDLYFLRHAKAVPRTGRTAMRDPERELTPEGIEKMRSVAVGMRTLGLSFDLVLTSPYARTRATADIIGEVFKVVSKITLAPALAPDGDPQALINDLLHRRRAVGSVLLIGHEPYLSELISTLIAGEAAATLTMKKAGLCKLSTHALRYGRCASLEWFLTPRQLVLLSKV